MSNHEIESKARELRQWLALIEEAQAQAGEYKITWKAVTSSRLDTVALKQALPEIAARFTKESTTRRFIVA